MDDTVNAAAQGDAELWRQLGEQCLAEESRSVLHLSALLDCNDDEQAAISAQARAWIDTLRQSPPTFGVEALLLEYPLNSREGMALMTLAEALLRIPDPSVADHLIRDLLSPIIWRDHRGQSRSRWVNGVGWGLALCGRWLDGAATAPAWQHGLAERLGAPLLRHALQSAMRYMAGQFVFAQDLPCAQRRMQRDWQRGETHSLDMLGEAALTAGDSERYLQAYRLAIDALADSKPPASVARPSISVKLSALHPRFHSQHISQLQRELLPQLIGLAEQAAAAEIDLTIDAEEADRCELTLQLFAQVLAALPPSARRYIGIAVQAYSKRAWPALMWLGDLAARNATVVKIRLVKGAYWDSEIKRAQQRGLADYPVFTTKAATDISYLACARWLIAHPQWFFPQFATHNAASIAAILHWRPDLARCEFQRLQGMGEMLYRTVRLQYPMLRCRIYAPIGEHRELLPYLVRRLLENGANTSFMHQLYDSSLASRKLATHPLQLWPPPTAPLVKPQGLWPMRRNSPGIYLHCETERAEFFSELENYRWHLYDANDAAGENSPAAITSVRSPYDGSAVGSWRPATAAQIDTAVEIARGQQTSWQRTSIETRAAYLEKYADLLLQRRTELVALMARETGKTLENGLDEVREAVDLCRYYAQQARLLLTEPMRLPGSTGEDNRLHWIARGSFVCISPWNFPLAIFSGQIAAALLMGNTVLAKPAEQATLTAQLATQLLHSAGVPRTVMQLLAGDGETVGRQLCGHHGIDGIVFTGGWDTARSIQQQLAQRSGAIIPLIAETAGINTLIADSSAQPQQLVTDVLRSAFDSAGQRCSALRVLYLPDSCACDIERLLCDALQQLTLGDPLAWSTDIGPIIDNDAHAQLLDYLEQRKGLERHSERVIAQSTVPVDGLFVPLTVLRLQHIGELDREAFGPILHIIRYADNAIDQIVEQINNCGYGLTCGIHSRNEQRALHWAQRLRVGNIYINRDIVGAVVEAQPFGGMGKSGTGPKAGGPHYLQRFACEKTISINTSALGGDYRLLAK